MLNRDCECSSFFLRKKKLLVKRTHLILLHLHPKANEDRSFFLNFLYFIYFQYHIASQFIFFYKTYLKRFENGHQLTPFKTFLRASLTTHTTHTPRIRWKCIIKRLYFQFLRKKEELLIIRLLSVTKLRKAFKKKFLNRAFFVYPYFINKVKEIFSLPRSIFLKILIKKN